MLQILSDRIAQLKPSSTVVFDTLVKHKMEKGEKIVSMVAGESIEGTSSVICEAAILSIQQQKVKYGSSAGLMDLRKKVSQKLKQDNGLDYDVDQIVISSGVKQSIYETLIVLLNAKDEVIIPIPYWVTYPDLVYLCQAKPVFVETSSKNQFKMTAQELERAITPSTKLVILNSPNNPSGFVYSKEELEKLSTVIIKYNLYCLSDEIYEKIIYEKHKHVSIAFFPEMLERTIVVNGFSKAYAMTGWRLGYSASSSIISKGIAHFQSQTSHHPSMIAQYAGIGALSEGDCFFKILRSNLEEKRMFVQEVLTTIKHIHFHLPSGAFYFWIDVSFYLDNSNVITNSEMLSLHLLDKFKVGVMAGSAFGLDGMIRISFTPNISNLKEGLQKFKEGLYSLL